MKNELLNMILNAPKPVRRGDLEAAFYPIKDRKIREIIAELQNEGHQIVNNGKGYKIATNGELEKYISVNLLYVSSAQH